MSDLLQKHGRPPNKIKTYQVLVPVPSTPFPAESSSLEGVP